MNKEQLKKGDIIECCGITAYVVDPNYKENYVKVNLGNTCRARVLINKDWLSIWNFANPIKDNRIVDSYTFAVRFKQFLDWIPENFYMSGPHILEEYEYMKYVADSLLKYQIQTATDEKEINYLKRLNLYE
jgi:hypothetical protein